MGYNHERIKSNARLFYQNNKGNSIVAVIILLGVSFGASYILTRVIVVVGMLAGITTGAAAARSFEAGIDITFIFMHLFLGASSIAAVLALSPMHIGFYGWYRNSIYRSVPYGEIFSYYKQGRFWSSVFTGFLMQLYVFLWSMLFIIPGLIKSYSYSQTFFIKAENPNIPAGRAIELSKLMMDGHKWDLFYLHLSFLGWSLLSALTLNILGIVYVFPYYYAALAFAYDEIKADAAARGVIDINEIMQADMNM
ncbi:MAG: DUF975 family protein [Ruminococcus sp.]|nr:DUF975 family protein [Ruminococcus sp.]MCM1381552.1 DUF975 family protein [Muribaculaceae bacterium]MCM1478093.1 DUF975 family protein [Muribaculaceae bacterium]